MNMFWNGLLAISHLANIHNGSSRAATRMTTVCHYNKYIRPAYITSNILGVAQPRYGSQIAICLRRARVTLIRQRDIDFDDLLREVMSLTEEANATDDRERPSVSETSKIDALTFQ